MLLAIGLAAGPAAAERSVALLPVIASGKAPPELLAAADAAIGQVAKTWLAVDLLVGDELGRRLRGNGARQASACASEPACLAKLGRRLKVDEIALVTARPSGDGARLTFLVVGVADRRVRRTVSVTGERLGALEVAIFEQWHSVLGVERSALSRRVAPASPAPTPAGDELAELELAPMPDLAPITPPIASGAAAEAPSAGGDVGAPPGPEAAAGPAPAIAALPVDPSPPGPLAPVPAPAPRSSGALWWAGWAMAGAGAAVLGASGYYGLRYETKKGAIDADGYLTTPLPKALRLQREANDARGTGILLAIVGSAVAVAGGTLLVVELATDVEVSYGLGPGGAAAGLRLAF